MQFSFFHNLKDMSNLEDKYININVYLYHNYKYIIYNLEDKYEYLPVYRPCSRCRGARSAGSAATRRSVRPRIF